jgi:hypothetical protein
MWPDRPNGPSADAGSAIPPDRTNAGTLTAALIADTATARERQEAARNAYFVSVEAGSPLTGPTSDGNSVAPTDGAGCRSRSSVPTPSAETQAETEGAAATFPLPGTEPAHCTLPHDGTAQRCLRAGKPTEGTRPGRHTTVSFRS